MIRKQAILRWTLTALFVMSALDTALGADKVVTPHAKRTTRVILPAGLPRPHYDYRTTVIYAPAAPAPVYVEDPPLISPPTTPILPGSSTRRAITAVRSITIIRAPITAMTAPAPATPATSSACPTPAASPATASA